MIEVTHTNSTEIQCKAYFWLGIGSVDENPDLINNQ